MTTSRRPSDAAMRVSDAERAQAADRLARHYADGRLDDAEFDARLDRAMRATTRADLLGLFADLPENVPDIRPPASPRRDRRRRRQLPRPLVAVLLVLALVLLLGSVARQVFSIWVVIAILVIVWLSGRRRGSG